ncbi:hypothetical protein [Qipengyuania flava]|uniref:hypothetical protein n=1 Tax=Qipengyuania flava TaxID=192812 RepID=UPI0012FDA71F|nr:hypothetical protein [Qipengyuania flava]
MSDTQIIRFVKSRERSHALIEIVEPAPCWGSLERQRDRDRAILSVGYPGFDYRETVTGYSKLMIYDVELPEAACRGQSKRGLRLSQLIRLRGKNSAFLRKADPVVLTLRNRGGDHRTGLELRMQDEWSRANWNF